MKIFRDGISVGKEITRKYMPNSNQEEVISKLKTVFEDKFILSRAIQGYIYNKNLFYKKYLEAVECSKNDLKIPPQVSSLWFNIFLENYEQSFWTSCTTGQRAELFVACSSTELNPSIIFGNGVEVREGVLYGNFGVCSDIKNFEDIKNTNDFVPFSYMITHNNLPKAIIFLSSVESLDKTKNCDICSFEQKIRDANIVCSDPVGLVNLRRLKYVQDVKDAKHYSDNYGYKHVILKEGKEFFHKIPIIAAVFNKADNSLYVVEEDCKISYKLKDILPKNEQFFLRLIKHLESLEKENIYSSIISFSKLRQIGCVDARIRNILIPNNYIKEIGSTLNSYQIKNLLNSDLDAIISSSHTNCGYISTLYSIHIANNELREVFGDKKPILRKILEASYSKLLNGKIGVFFGHAEVKAAINEAELSGLFISEKTKRFLLDFISYPSHDTRKTLRHALFRQKVYIDDEGYLVLKAAKNLEEKINQLPYKLSQQKIDFLLNEESARENIKSIIENLSKSNDANSITALASYVFEIGSANKLSISLSPPEKEEDFYFISRKLFFDPKKEIAL